LVRGSEGPAIYRGENCEITHQMHVTQLRQILRDAEVANAISMVVHEYRLTEELTERALAELHVPRAANVAEITHRAFPIHALLCNYQGQLWSKIARL